MGCVSHHLKPHVIGSGVGSCGDGCAISSSSFGCSADGVLHRAAGGFACGNKCLCLSIIGQCLGFRYFGYNRRFFRRRRGQRDRDISGRSSGNRDLRIAVADYGDSVDGSNTVIIRKVIAVICGINHICHRSRQSGLRFRTGACGLCHIASCRDNHTIFRRTDGELNL